MITHALLHWTLVDLRTRCQLPPGWLGWVIRGCARVLLVHTLDCHGLFTLQLIGIWFGRVLRVAFGSRVVTVYRTHRVNYSSHTHLYGLRFACRCHTPALLHTAHAVRLLHTVPALLPVRFCTVALLRVYTATHRVYRGYHVTPRLRLRLRIPRPGHTPVGRVYTHTTAVAVTRLLLRTPAHYPVCAALYGCRIAAVGILHVVAVTHACTHTRCCARGHTQLTHTVAAHARYLPAVPRWLPHFATRYTRWVTVGLLPRWTVLYGAGH